MPDAVFIQARIDATKLAIIAYEDAFLALANGTQSYTLDTGQNRQTVTQFNLTEMRRNVDALYNRLATLEARLSGGSVTVAPIW